MLINWSVPTSGLLPFHFSGHAETDAIAGIPDMIEMIEQRSTKEDKLKYLVINCVQVYLKMQYRLFF